MFYGDNDYSIRQEVIAECAEYEKKYGAGSTKQVDASELSPGDLPSLLSGQSLFAPNQLHVISLLSEAKSLWERFGEVAETTEIGDVLLVDTKPDKRTKTWKWLNKHADVKQFNLLSEREVVPWLDRHASDRGLTLSRDNVELLVDRCGSDQWRLHHAVQKLRLVEGAVTADVIKEVIEPTPQSSAFELIDAIISGNTALAEKRGREISAAEDAYRFFGLLVSQIYAMAACKTARHSDPSIIAREVGIHPYVAKKTLPVARRLSMTQLESMVSSAVQCDMMLKSSGAEPWSLIKSLIAELTIKARS